MSKALDIELELRQNYVDSDVTESIVRYINAHGFDAHDVDEILVELGYDEIFCNADDINHQEEKEETTQNNVKN